MSCPFVLDLKVDSRALDLETKSELEILALQNQNQN